jgi:hypothetical protein
MTHTSKPLGSEFDAFLFAPIGEEKNGMLLSVLSALARLDVDPWREAAELARMPKTAANRRVTSLIAELEFASTAPVEPETVALRLIELLPCGAHSLSVPSQPPPVEGAVLSRSALLCVVLLRRGGELTASTIVFWQTGRDGVVPFWMEWIAFDVESGHFGVADFDALGIGVFIEFAADREAIFRRGCGDQFDNRRATR